jgi:soluble lytic murein transglycosylase-like protein
MDKIGKIDIEPNIKTFEYSRIPEVSNLKKKNISNADKKQIEKSARDFEGMFLYLIFKNLRKAMLSEFSDKENDSFGGDILNDITLMEATRQISKNGLGTGIANKIYEQLTGEKLVQIEFSPVRNEKKTTSTKSKAIQDKPKESSQQINLPRFPTLVDRISKYDRTVEEIARKYNLTPELLKSVIAVESAGDHLAVSPAGAKGLMQLIDSTAKYVGVRNVFDPEENIEGGAKYLREMLDTFDGNLELALAAYNAGPGNVFKYNGIPPFKETRNYVSRVKYYLSIFNNIGKEL